MSMNPEIFSALVSAQTEDYLLISPAGRPPTFGLDVPWAHMNFAPGEFGRRLDNVWRLMLEMKDIPAMPKHTVSADTITQVLGALYQSFDPHGEPADSLESLLNHSIAGSNVLQICEAGVFGTMPQTPTDKSKPFTDLKQLLSLDARTVFFDSDKYQTLPAKVKDFLGGLNLLLVPHRYNNHRVSVTLQPLSGNVPADQHYIDFYSALTKLRISSFFSIKGTDSIYDGYLGIYDLRAVGNSRETLFPQYADEERKQGQFEKDIRIMKIVGRASGDDLAHVELIDDVSGSKICISRVSGKVAEVTVDGVRSRLPNIAKVSNLLDAMILDRQTYQLHMPIEVDMSILKEPKELFQITSEEEIARSLLDKGGQPDVSATNIYHEIIDKLSGGAINFSYVGMLIKLVEDKLSEDQLNFISLGLTNYTFDALSLGMIADLEGMEDILKLLLKHCELYPEVANRLRLYVDTLEPYVVLNVAKSIDRFGVVNSSVDLIALQSDDDESFNSNPDILAKSHGGSLTDWERQEKRMARLVKYLQEKLPGISIDEETVFELKKYSEMLVLMQGQNIFLDKEMIEPKLAATLTVFFECMIGRELPLLRKAIPYRSKLLLEGVKTHSGKQFELGEGIN